MELCVCVCCFQCLEECEGHGLPPTEQGRLDLEMKIEDTKENIRKAEVSDSRCWHVFLITQMIIIGYVPFAQSVSAFEPDPFCVKFACSPYLLGFIWVLHGERMDRCFISSEIKRWMILLQQTFSILEYVFIEVVSVEWREKRGVCLCSEWRCFIFSIK